MLREIRRKAQYRLDYLQNWEKAGFFGAPYFRAQGTLTDLSPEGGLQVASHQTTFLFIDRNPPWGYQEIRPQCGSSSMNLTALRFSRQRAWLLVGMQAVHFCILHLSGALFASTCQYYTKDQWNYLEAIQGGKLLIASANNGQIMFFSVSQGAERGVVALTQEFDHRERGVARLPRWRNRPPGISSSPPITLVGLISGIWR